MDYSSSDSENFKLKHMLIDPLVSIGIPCFNGGKLLKNIFFLEQSYRKIEIIISDDNSQDNTKIF